MKSISKMLMEELYGDLGTYKKRFNRDSRKGKKVLG
jgi:hypothetical protein